MSAPEMIAPAQTESGAGARVSDQPARAERDTGPRVRDTAAGVKDQGPIPFEIFASIAAEVAMIIDPNDPVRMVLRDLAHSFKQTPTRITTCDELAQHVAANMLIQFHEAHNTRRTTSHSRARGPREAVQAVDEKIVHRIWKTYERTTWNLAKVGAVR